MVDELKIGLKDLCHKATIESYSEDDPSLTEDCVKQIDEHSEFKGIPLKCNLRDRRDLVALKRSFIQHIIREFEDRFPDEALGILNDLNIILNPKLLPHEQANIRQHGTESIERCIQKYGEGENPIINPQVTRNSFLQFKYVVNANREKNLQEFCSLVIQEYKDAFQDFVKLACVLLTCPLTSVPCERGFSLQNRHHCASSSRRTVSNVENRMQIEFASKQPGYDQNAMVVEAAERFSNDRH